MNYHVLNYIPSTCVIEQVSTKKITFMNPIASQVFHVQPDTQYSIQDFLIDDKLTQDLYQNINIQLNKAEKATGIFLLHLSSEQATPFSYECFWFDKDKEYLCYILCPAYAEQMNLQDITNSLMEGILVMSIEPELAFVYGNPQHYEMFGLQKEDLKQPENRLLKNYISSIDTEYTIHTILKCVSQDKVVDVTFSLRTQNNQKKYVRLYGRAKEDSHGKKLLFATLEDLGNTQAEDLKEHLLYKMAELSNEVLFKLDFKTNSMHFLSEQSNIFTPNSVIEQFQDTIINAQKIHEEDIPLFQEMIENMKNSISKSVELRIQTKANDFQWYQISYNFIYDMYEMPMIVIGKMTNIQYQKILEERSRVDLLTGFYNKSTTALEIDSLLKGIETEDETETEDVFVLEEHRIPQEGAHAFFIIDIDNFKAINDNLGHHFGDMVLKELAGNIRSCFRKTDIFGRIGGDEFIVIMKHCQNDVMIRKKAQAICDILCKTYQGANDIYQISASVGIALSPQDGLSYEALYKMADRALYISKGNGKNCYTRYHKNLVQRSNRDGGAGPNGLDRRRSDETDFGFVSAIFHVLFEDDDLSTNLSKVLKKLTSYYKVEHCFIYKSDSEFIYSQASSSDLYIQKISADILFQDLEKEDKKLLCIHNAQTDVSNEELKHLLGEYNIQSLLLTQSNHLENQSMLFGLHDDKNLHTWSMKEYNTFLHIAKILFSLIIKFENNSFNT